MHAVVNSIRLAYEVFGASGSWVVMTHGLGEDMDYWRDLLDPITREQRVLTWDIRGAGRSDKPAGPYSPEIFAADLGQLLDHLGIERAHLVGHSAGGVISQRFTLDHAPRVASLTLISTSSEVGEKASRAWQKLAERVEASGFSALRNPAERAFAPAFANSHPDVVARAQARAVANEPGAYAACARAMSNYNWTSDLRRILAPVLILQGTEDRLTPPGGSRILKRHLPRARLIMVPGAGHNIPLEQPAVVASAITAFLAGLELAGTTREASPGV